MNEIDRVLTNFFEAAEVVIADGLAHARRLDPHRVDALVAEMDPHRLERRLLIDFKPQGRYRVALQLGDEHRAVEVFSTTVQGPYAGEFTQ
jgi:hypothetical protein